MMRHRFWWVMVIAACGGVDGTSAGGAGGAGACPNDLPASCPAEVPSYAAEIAPLIHDRCAPCHSPGGQAATKPLTSYVEVYGRRSAVLDQLHACNMPPPAAAQPTATERKAILGWLVCGAPSN